MAVSHTRKLTLQLCLQLCLHVTLISIANAAQAQSPRGWSAARASEQVQIRVEDVDHLPLTCPSDAEALWVPSHQVVASLAAAVVLAFMLGLAAGALIHRHAMQRSGQLELATGSMMQVRHRRRQQQGQREGSSEGSNSPPCQGMQSMEAALDAAGSAGSRNGSRQRGDEGGDEAPVQCEGCSNLMALPWPPESPASESAPRHAALTPRSTAAHILGGLVKEGVHAELVETAAEQPACVAVELAAPSAARERGDAAEPATAAQPAAKKHIILPNDTPTQAELAVGGQVAGNDSLTLTHSDVRDIQAAGQMVAVMCSESRIQLEGLSIAERLQLVGMVLTAWQAKQAQQHTRLVHE
jgi:hypothetical protein